MTVAVGRANWMKMKMLPQIRKWRLELEDIRMGKVVKENNENLQPVVEYSFWLPSGLLDYLQLESKAIVNCLLSCLCTLLPLYLFAVWSQI